MKVYDELVARGLIAQVTDEEEIKELINNGKAMYISPPITIPINITGKKITVQSNFRIPQDAFKPNIKNFPINQIIQIVNNNDNIFFLLLTLIQL